MAKQKTFNKFLKASIWKLCQEDKEEWDQVLPQILFAYRCCSHTSIGESPYNLALVHGRDPVLPIHKLIKVTTPYQGENSLGKSIEQSKVTLSIAAKMLREKKEKTKRGHMKVGKQYTNSGWVTLSFSRNMPKKSCISNGKPTIESLDCHQPGLLSLNTQ